jgi:hypothetical protein
MSCFFSLMSRLNWGEINIGLSKFVFICTGVFKAFGPYAFTQ